MPFHNNACKQEAININEGSRCQSVGSGQENHLSLAHPQAAEFVCGSDYFSPCITFGTVFTDVLAIFLA